MAHLSTSELCNILTSSKKFDSDMVETFRSYKIDGELFLDLENDDLKDLGIVALGDRKKIRALKEKSKRLVERTYCFLLFWF